MFYAISISVKSAWFGSKSTKKHQFTKSSKNKTSIAPFHHSLLRSQRTGTCRVASTLPALLRQRRRAALRRGVPRLAAAARQSVAPEVVVAQQSFEGEIFLGELMLLDDPESRMQLNADFLKQREKVLIRCWQYRLFMVRILRNYEQLM